MPDTTIKAINAEGRVGGYLVVWGSPQQRDLQGEYFTPQTDLGLEWYEQRPALYHHGLDGELQTATVGVIDTLKMDSIGLWAEAQLDMRKRYVQAVMRLVDKGALGWSSGSMPHLVDVAADGQIKRWPIVEGSLTPTPAEPRHTNIHSIKSLPQPPELNQYVFTIKSAYAALNLDPARLQLPDLDDPAAEPPEEPLQAKEVATAKKDVLIEIEPEQEYGEAETLAQEETSTMNPKDLVLQVLNSILQAKPEWQMPPEEVDALATQIAGTIQPAGEGMASVPPEQVAAVAQQVAPAVIKALTEHFAASDAVKTANAQAIADATKNAMMSAPPISRVTPFTGGGKPRNPGAFEGMGQLDRRFDHLKATEMALGYVMLRKLKKPVSEDYLTAMAYKTAQLVERDDVVANDWAVKSQLPAIKANEVMQVALSNFGAEYAHTYFSSEVWQMVRQETKLYDRMLAKGMDEKEVPAGYKSDTVPLEGGDMTWYNAGGGATDEDASSGNVTPVTSSSKMGTDQKEVTLARLSARGFWEKELEEDSIVNIVSEARRKILASGKEQVEMILANGDTDVTANTNINLIDGTPAAAPNKPAYTLLNGLAKLPLVTNTANVYNAANTLNEAVYLNLLPLLGTDGKYAADPENILFLVTNGTYFASLALAVLKTQDVFPSATIVEGVLRKIWGVELLRSAQFGNAQATGKVSATPGNNIFGRVLLVRPDQWATRWKREIEIFMTFDDNAYVTRLTAHMRWGATYRDNEASAIARNVNTTIT